MGAALGGSRGCGLAWCGRGSWWPPWPSAAAAVVPGEAPWARAGPVPCATGVPGAAAWLAGAAVAAPCGMSGGASEAPPGGGAGGAAAWAPGAASPAGSGSGAGGAGLPGTAWGCSAGGPTGTAASVSRCSSRSAEFPLSILGNGGAGVGPPVVPVIPLRGGIGVRHPSYPDRRALLQASLSNYLPVHRWGVVGGAVSCRGRGHIVAVAPGGHGPVAIHLQRGGRRARNSAHTLRHSSQSRVGLRALGPRGSSGVAGGGRTRWTPVTASTSWVRRKACTPSRASDSGRGGGARALPRKGGMRGLLGPAPGPGGWRR